MSGQKLPLLSTFVCLSHERITGVLGNREACRFQSMTHCIFLFSGDQQTAPATRLGKAGKNLTVSNQHPGIAHFYIISCIDGSCKGKCYPAIKKRLGPAEHFCRSFGRLSLPTPPQALVPVTGYIFILCTCSPFIIQPALPR